MQFYYLQFLQTVGAAVHLFIFNSNKVTKIIIIFLLLLITYNVFLIICNPKITGFQNQQQKNYSTAQDFIYGDKTSNIIVGSSLSARLSKSILPSDYYNLSFSGGSVLTGLELIKQTGYIPKRIYVESNFIFRNKSIKMLDDLFYPIWWKVKGYIPSLKEKFQPLNVINSKNKCYTKPKIKSKKSTNWKRPKNLENIVNSKKFKFMMKQQKKKLNKKLNYTHQLKDLQRLITYFEDKGTIVVFFEMPIEKSLANASKSIQRRNILNDTFKNRWLPLPTYEKYFTRDGHHLVDYSAWMYTKKFLDDVKKSN